MWMLRAKGLIIRTFHNNSRFYGKYKILLPAKGKKQRPWGVAN